LAWTTLPNSPKYRLGVIMVGISRCIAMGMIWSNLARGDCDYCAIIVVFNAILQMILYPPYALLFADLIGEHDPIRVSYVATSISVLIVSCSNPRFLQSNLSLISIWAFPSLLELSLDTVSGR